MTTRLYFTDAYQQKFTATVTAIGTWNDQPSIQLDQSCFYPTSGGQAFDTGKLAGFHVIEVVADKAGEIHHLLAEKPDGVVLGTTISGQIDWPRRYDHMQQHSGQHLLSQLFFQELGFETVSVHFGAQESTLDLEIEEISAEQLAKVELLANELVYTALPIHAYFVDERKIADLPLRRPPKVSGTIRIVEIEAFDFSACGGTHCRTTAEVGPIKLIKVERRRGLVRISFLCGKRAYVDYATKHQLITDAAMIFSTDTHQVPQLIERNLSQLKEANHRIEELQFALLAHEASALIQNAEAVGPVRLIQAVYDNKQAGELKTLATQLQQHDETVALLAAIERGTDADKVTICFACSSTVTATSTLNLGAVLRMALQPVGGKGGGKADFAQGGGISTGKIDGVIQSAHEAVSKLLRDELCD
ncbi:MAG: DHHA1 domain-containing protein [Caldilineaceae bacterium]